MSRLMIKWLLLGWLLVKWLFLGSTDFGQVKADFEQVKKIINFANFEQDRL